MQDGKYIRMRRQVPWRKIPATLILIIINIIWFVLVEGRHGLNPAGLVSSGALLAPAVAGGQWFRLLSAMFVHVSTAHLAVNMISLYSLYLIEILIGTRAYALIYLMSGFVGFLLTDWLSPGNVVAAGASGAVFGIFGAALVLAFQGILTRGTRNQLIVVLILNLVYGLFTPSVGMTGHVAGLITGLLCTYAVVKRGTGRVTNTLAGVAVGVTIIALILALQAGNAPVSGYQ